jgi:hypothetical protein
MSIFSLLVISTVFTTDILTQTLMYPVIENAQGIVTPHTIKSILFMNRASPIDQILTVVWIDRFIENFKGLPVSHGIELRIKYIKKVRSMIQNSFKSTVNTPLIEALVKKFVSPDKNLPSLPIANPILADLSDFSDIFNYLADYLDFHETDKSSPLYVEIPKLSKYLSENSPSQETTCFFFVLKYLKSFVTVYYTKVIDRIFDDAEALIEETVSMGDVLDIQILLEIQDLLKSREYKRAVFALMCSAAIPLFEDLKVLLIKRMQITGDIDMYKPMKQIEAENNIPMSQGKTFYVSSERVKMQLRLNDNSRMSDFFIQSQLKKKSEQFHDHLGRVIMKADEAMRLDWVKILIGLGIP